MGIARRRLALVTVMLGLLVGGCGVVKGINDTKRAIENAGFSDVSVEFEATNGVDSVDVRYRSTATSREALDVEVRRIAEAVWNTAPLRLDVVTITPIGSSAGGEVATINRAALQQEFGPRPASVNEKNFGDLANAKGIFIGFVIAFLVILAVIVLVVVLVVRASRRRRAQPMAWAGGYPGQPPGAPGWQAPPAAPGSWPAQPQPPAGPPYQAPPPGWPQQPAPPQAPPPGWPPQPPPPQAPPPGWPPQQPGETPPPG